MPLEEFTNKGQTKGMKHKRYRVDLIKVNQSTGKNKHAPVIICLILFCILPLKSAKRPKY